MSSQIPRAIRIDSNWGWDMEAKISEDAQTWFDAELLDISAGGIAFKTDKSYSPKDALWLDVYINPKMLTVGDIHINAKGRVTGVRSVGGGHAVSVEFTEIPRDTQSRLGVIMETIIVKYGDFDIYNADV